MDKILGFFETYQPFRHLATALLILFLGYRLARFASHWIERALVRAQIEPTVTRFVTNISYYVMFSVVIIITLGELGIQMIDPVPRLFLECKPSPRTRLVFHVGSGSRAKNWSAYCWSELVTRLEHRFEELLLVSGEADAACTAEFLRQYQNPKLKIGSSLSILDLAHELAVADLFIGHDTGVTHLAAALGVPTIALFGPTDPVIWRPLGEHVQVVASGDSTMASITVETVAELVAARGKRKKNVGDGPS